MNSLRHFELRDQFGVLWIMNIDNGSSIGWIDMADIGIAVFHRHHPPPGRSVLPTCLMFLLMPNSGKFSWLIRFLPSYILINSVLLTDLNRGGQTQGKWGLS